LSLAGITTTALQFEQHLPEFTGSELCPSVQSPPITSISIWHIEQVFMV